MDPSLGKIGPENASPKEGGVLKPEGKKTVIKGLAL
jgi:hypothetical protein